jgi:hypothetical protein
MGEGATGTYLPDRAKLPGTVTKRWNRLGWPGWSVTKRWNRRSVTRTGPLANGGIGTASPGWSVNKRWNRGGAARLVR